MVSPGTEDRHLQGATRLSLHPEMTSFIRGEMQQRIKDGFSILLPAADAIQLFGERLKLSRIAAVPHAHCRPRLILNLLAQPDSDTISVNKTTDREAPRSRFISVGPSPVSCRRYGRRTWSRVRSGSQNWASQAHNTVALLSQHR